MGDIYGVGTEGYGKYGGCTSVCSTTHQIPQPTTTAVQLKATRIPPTPPPDLPT